MQSRARRCLTNNPGPGLCQGRNREERFCLNDQNLQGNTQATNVSFVMQNFLYFLSQHFASLVLLFVYIIR